MLLGIIRGYINQYVNQYFENIDASQLSGSVFYGAILHDLSFRKAILENLDLPFSVIAGKCGTLEIQYTWYKLYSEPVVVKLKDLHILVVPSRPLKFDINAEKAAQQQEKHRKLEVYETMKKHIDEAHSRRKSQGEQSNEGSPAAAPSYFDEWVLPIINNIQVHIESVHLRFEDDYTKKHEPFAIGFTLQDLSVLATDSEWNSQFVKGPIVGETTHKLVKIHNLAVYWNPAPTTMYKGVEDKNVLFERLSALPTEVKEDPAFKTMFGPLTLDLKIEIAISPDTQKVPFSKPTIQLHTNLEQFLCTVSDKQIKDILPFTETMDVLFKGFQFRQYRPALPEGAYKEHYKEWWKFAYTCVLTDITRRRNNFRWSIIAEHRAKCSKYLKAYYKKHVKKISSAAADSTITKLEEELDLFNLILLRKQAEMIDVRKAKVLANSQDASEASYVSAATNWVWSWWAPTPPTPDLTVTAGNAVQQQRRKSSGIFSVYELSPDDKECLKMSVGFAKNVDVVNFPADFVDFEMTAVFTRIQIKIRKSQRNLMKTILDTVMDKVNLKLQIRPKNSGILVKMKMGRLEAYGGDFPTAIATNSNVLTSSAPQIIATANRGVQEYFLKLVYEKSPLNVDTTDPPDHKISFEGLATQFIYNEAVIDNIIECFEVPKHAQPTILGKIPTDRVLQNLLNFKNYPTSRVLRMMENKGKVEVNVILVSPRLVIPQHPTNGRPSFFVIELGTINLMGTVVGGTICEHGACSYMF